VIEYHPPTGDDQNIGMKKTDAPVP